MLGTWFFAAGKWHNLAFAQTVHFETVFNPGGLPSRGTARRLARVTFAEGVRFFFEGKDADRLEAELVALSVADGPPPHPRLPPEPDEEPLRHGGAAHAAADYPEPD